MAIEKDRKPAELRETAAALVSLLMREKEMDGPDAIGAVYSSRLFGLLERQGGLPNLFELFSEEFGLDMQDCQMEGAALANQETADIVSAVEHFRRCWNLTGKEAVCVLQRCNIIPYLYEHYSDLPFYNPWKLTYYINEFIVGAQTGRRKAAIDIVTRLVSALAYPWAEAVQMTSVAESEDREEVEKAVAKNLKEKGLAHLVPPELR